MKIWRFILNRIFNIFSLRNRYIPALLIIAVLSTMYYFNDVNLMASVKDDAKIINLSGKQRMYSQQLVILAKNYLDKPSAANVQLLSEKIVLMKKNHEFLKTQKHSPKLETIYDNKILDNELQRYFKTLYLLIDTRNIEQLNSLSIMSQELLLLLDSVVTEYENADKAKILKIETKEKYIYLMILLVLLFEAVFIFYPASQKIEEHTHKLEEAIQEKTKELQKSIDIISDYVIYSRTDLKGIITYASKEFINISGYSKEELIGHPHNIVRHKDVPKEAFEDMWKTIKQGKTWRGEVKNRKKDGGFYWVEANISPEYDKNGNIIGYAAVRHNITLQKEIEQINKNLESKVANEVQKNRKKDIQLHEQSKMLQMSEMIGNIAHQWRQPLSVISTASSGLKLKKEMDMLSDEEYYEMLDTIIKNTKNLSKTIDTFSGFINYKKNRSDFCLQERVDDTLRIIEKTLQNHEIKLIKDYDEETIMVHNFAALLSQALLNILTNAKETLLQREIEKPEIYIKVCQDNQRAKVMIEDNAGGIEENTMGKIFDPYFTTKHQSMGAGMGLHSSYTIVVNDLHGELYVKNSKKGAQFFIEIPLS